MALSPQSTTAHSLDPIPLVKREPVKYTRRHPKQIPGRNVHPDPFLVLAVLGEVEEARAVEDVADFFLFKHVPIKDERQY